ncbi:6-bladed beta-propeller [Candidatus Saganbacteria bacterium]|nr:6-bladed beta-propeller [Candidatus Saganbacteria bacterium]
MHILECTHPLKGISNKAFLLALFIAASFFLSGLVWPRAPETPKIEYLYSFSKPEDLKIEKKSKDKLFDFIFGLGRGQNDNIVRPQGIYAKNNIIYVTDTGLGAVHVFDLSKKEYFKIKKFGNTELKLPVSAASDDNGNIYVADSGLNKVLLFDGAGNYKSEIGRGIFSRPCGIAIDSVLKRIYVVDAISGLVDVFNSDHDFVASFPSTKEGLNHPTYIVLDQKSNIYVVDSLNFRVQVYSPEGKKKSEFGKMGRAPGSFSLPKGIAIDSNKNIYVTDSSFDNVQIFNGKGGLLLFFGESGNKEGEFWVPAAISIDERDHIYVADSYNNRVQVFRFIK